MKSKILAVTVVAGFFGLPAVAQEGGLASKLPAETILYFEIPNVQGIAKNAPYSALGRIYLEQEVQNFLGGGLTELGKAWDQIRSMALQEGVPGELMKWDALTSIEAGVCILPTLTDQSTPTFCGGVAIGLKPGLVDQVFELASGILTAEAGFQLKEGESGSVLHLSYPSGERVEITKWGNRLVAWTQNGDAPATKLAEQGEFRAARGNAMKDGGLVFGYLDLGRMMHTIADVMREADPDAGNRMREFYDDMGLSSMGALTFTSGWRNGDSFSKTTFGFGASGPQGIFAQEVPMADLDLLGYIPAEATSFSVSTVDMASGFLGAQKGVVKMMPPEAFEYWKSSGHPSYDWIAGDKSEMLVRAVKGFGHRSFSFDVTSPSMMMGGGSGQGGSFIEVKDVAAVRELFTVLMPLLQELLDSTDEIPVGLEIKTVQIRERNEAGEMQTRQGPEYYSFKIRGDRLPREMSQMMMFLGGIRPTFGVSDDGWLAMNFSSGATVRKILRSGVNKPDTNVLSNPEVKGFVDRLPGDVYSMSWSDPRPMIGGVVTMIGNFIPMIGAQIPAEQLPVDLSTFPSSAPFVKHLRPTETYSVALDNRYVTHSVGSFDLVDMLLAGGAVGLGIGPVAALWLAPGSPMRGGMAPEPDYAESGSSETVEPEVIAETGATEEQRQAVQKELSRLETGLLVFEMENQRWPSKLNELTQPHADYPKGFLPQPKQGLRKDPWGNDYIFIKGSGSDYQLYSAGANGKDEGGKGDDIATQSI